MAEPNSSLTPAWAHKSTPAAAENAPTPATRSPKIDDGTQTTSLRIQPDRWANSPVLAARRRGGTDVAVLEAIDIRLALTARRRCA